MANATEHAADKYYVPHESPWPIYGSATLFVFMIGLCGWLNEWYGPWVFATGVVMLIALFVGWFAVVINEHQRGMYNMQVDKSFRMGMMWFIFSEVMFFAAFFGALFYARQLSVPWIGGEGVKIFNKLLLFQDYTATWPTNGPAALGPRDDGSFETIPAFGLPAINTAILLLSGVTITIAHHALKEGNRKILNIIPRGNLLIGLFVRRTAGRGIHSRLHGTRTHAVHRHLRIDVLHADGLPRRTRDARCHHVARHLVPNYEGSLHAAATLRLRGRRVVLALR